jgi:cell division septation protein DedD
MVLIHKFHRRLHSIFYAFAGFSLVVIGGCGMFPVMPVDTSTEDISDLGETEKTPVQISESQPEKEEQGDSQTITRGELHAALMDFADRFAGTVTEFAIRFESDLPSRGARLEATRLRFYPLASAFQIAGGPNPGIALLDMVVLVTLNRIVWEEHWRAQVFGAPAEVMVGGFRKLEADIWSISKKVLTQTQQEELSAVILEWRHKNPAQIRVNFVRFSDFGELRPDSPLAAALRAGGLLPEVAEAARAADEIRLLGDRAMYMLSRMQTLTNLQVDLAYEELLSQPEITQIFSDTTRFVDISDRFAKIFEQVPAQIASERSAAITHFFKELSKERESLLERLLSEERRIKGLFGDLHQILETGNELAARINTTVTSVDTIAARFDTGPAQKSSEPFDIKDYQLIVSDFSGTVSQLSSLVNAIEELLVSPKLDQRLSVVFKVADRMETLGQSWLKEAFVLVAALILIFFFILFLYRLVCRRLVDSSKGQAVAAMLLVAGAACAYAFHVHSIAASSQTVLPVSNRSETQRQDDAVFKALDTPNAAAFASPSIQQALPDRKESKSDPKGPDGAQANTGSSVKPATTAARRNSASIPATSLISTPNPGPKEPRAKRIKAGKDIPEPSRHPGVLTARTSAVVYSIHLESYRSADRVGQRVDFFKSLGFKAFSRCIDLPGKSIWYRVLVGAFDSRDQAQKYQIRIQTESSIAYSGIVSLPSEP